MRKGTLLSSRCGEHFLSQIQRLSHPGPFSTQPVCAIIKINGDDVMLSRNLEKAKIAYRDGNPELSRKAHDEESQSGEPHHEGGQRIKSLVYGGLDGIITTFAVVAGVAGAQLNVGIVLIMGFANLIADGISMAVGDYLSSKAENEYNAAERRREEWEVDNYPQGEKKELNKGMTLNDAEQVVEIISKDRKTWVDIMMVEELGIIEDEESPFKNAFVTFFSFGFFGFLPLLAYVLSRFMGVLEDNTFLAASGLTALTLFVLGAQKVRITGKNWLMSGTETLIIGGIAASAAYLVGKLLSGVA
jgi:VIT1/CCC1 family predicted Fe2+/Mn2+ transporter